MVDEEPMQIYQSRYTKWNSSYYGIVNFVRHIKWDSKEWFTIMIDEITDVSNAEQMVFCLRYVDAHLEVHEEFIGLYNLERTNAGMIVSVVKDVLLRMNLSITNCRGQCYDGASNMSGMPQ